MIMRRNTSILAAAVASLACAPAFAVSSASASLGPLSITLVDLYPFDGIAPSITFNAALGKYVYASAWDTSNGQSSNEMLVGAAAWDPGAVATSGVANAWAKSSIAGSGSADTTTFSASGAALGSGAPGNQAEFNGVAGMPYYGGSVFSLSAHTSVVISASSAVSAGVTHWWDPALGTEIEYAQATSGLVIADSVSGANDALQAYTNGKTYDTSPPCPSMVYGYCYGPDSVSDSRELSVSLVNDSDASVEGYMQAYVQAYGYSYAPAVPEPETWALMLAGLVGLRLVSSRCRLP